jgi:RecA/RadA recombinase
MGGGAFSYSASYGKTTIAQVLAGATIRGRVDPATGEVTPGEVMFVDVEGTYDAHWGDKLGLDSNHLTLFQPDTAEEALDIVSAAVKETYKDAQGRERGVYDLIVFDSLGALSFEAEQAGRAGDNHVGLAARKLSTWIRAITPALRVTGTSLVGTNHVSMRIGQSFGNPETMPGGLKIQYAASIIVAFNAPHRVPKNIDKPVEAMVFRLRASKNKTATPNLRSEVMVRMDDYFGPDIVPEIATLTRAYAIVTNKDGQPHKGGHIYYQGEPLEYAKSGKMARVGSEDALMDALYQDPDLRSELERECRLAIEAEFARGAARRDIDQEPQEDDLEMDPAPSHP